MPVTLTINNCLECPCYWRQPWISYSDDKQYINRCRKAGDKEIQDDEVLSIPEWCPLRKQ